MIAIGTKVKLKNWPTQGTVIGHSDGSPIIEVEPCVIGTEDIESYTDPKGLVRYPFYQQTRPITRRGHGNYR